MTDAQYITTELEALGYACTMFAMDARGHGSLPRRERLFWVAFESGDKEAGGKVQEVCDITRSNERSARLDEYLIDEDARHVYATEPNLEHTDRESKYKDDHITFYDTHKVPWPRHVGYGTALSTTSTGDHTRSLPFAMPSDRVRRSPGDPASIGSTSIAIAA